MINSRCPRPIGIIESIETIPVCIGSETDSRPIIPGAGDSIKRDSVVVMLPFPSIGVTNPSTTRPNKSSPTPICEIFPVARTLLPCLMSRPVPINTAPTLLVSRFNAIPIVPSSNSKSSPHATFSNPKIRAIPSPTCKTIPSSAVLVVVSVYSFNLFSTKFVN